VSAPFVLAAGGTGGHLFPAEALAHELLRRGRHVHLLTDARVEALAGRLSGVGIHRVRAGRLDGGPVRAARGLAELALGTLAARRLLRRLDPAAVIGFGGYVSVPTMLAAAHLRLPTAIHEQNAVLGRANRLLAPRVGRIATGFPAISGLRPAERQRASHTGNPVRPAILAAAGRGYAAPGGDAPIRLLVLGGSQGARVLSQIVPPALAALPPAVQARLSVAQQARSEDLSAVRDAYAHHRLAAEVQPFFTDVPERLAEAQLVICRAGASTIAELAAIGRPAVLIPYPYATDDHQSANAAAFAATGGGWVMPQAGLTAPALAEQVAALLGDPAQLRAAAERARQFGRRDAAERLAELALDLAGDATVAATECAA
jgi:UDP-N-acetylglucosamine--N-acetylmuramyl-(pentapeptide) pyrophosphoryl-undecaprenol N-acetylglucosamine transferase